MSAEMTFQALVDAVAQVHREMAAQAGHAVNLAVADRRIVWPKPGSRRASPDARLPRTASRGAAAEAVLHALGAAGAAGAGPEARLLRDRVRSRTSTTTTMSRPRKSTR